MFSGTGPLSSVLLPLTLALGAAAGREQHRCRTIRTTMKPNPDSTPDDIVTSNHMLRNRLFYLVVRSQKIILVVLSQQTKSIKMVSIVKFRC